MPRALFEKTGSAIWISHLDLMRVFQRAFKRAGLPLTHTHGFNPRASVSIALPLSVAIASTCELLDFELDGMELDYAEMKQRLNAALVSGVRIQKIYDDGRKLRDLSLLACRVTLEYDRGVPVGAEAAAKALFDRPSLIVPKKTKSGIQDQDIIPMIRSLQVKAGERELILEALVCCQNPTLNPMQLTAAITRELPELTPDFAYCTRLEIFDTKEQIFR